MPLRLSPTFHHQLAGTSRPLAGMWVCSGSAVMAEICAGAGLDWLLIDMEHSPNGLASVLAQLQAVAAYSSTPLVRVSSGDSVTLKQVLDLGAQNVLVPMVSTPQEAQEAVAAVHYPPCGRRGVGSALARSGRWNRVEHYLRDADEHVALFVQGLPGQQTHPDVVAAVLRAFEGVRAAGVPVGVNAFDPAQAQAYLDAGAEFILVGADVALVARGSEEFADRWVTRSAPGG